MYIRFCLFFFFSFFFFFFKRLRSTRGVRGSGDIVTFGVFLGLYRIPCEVSFLILVRNLLSSCDDRLLCEWFVYSFGEKSQGRSCEAGGPSSSLTEAAEIENGNFLWPLSSFGQVR